LTDGLCTFDWNNRRELLQLAHLPLGSATW